MRTWAVGERCYYQGEVVTIVKLERPDWAWIEFGSGSRLMIRTGKLHRVIADAAVELELF